MSKLSIVIPVYYSADTLEDTYRDLCAVVFPKLPDYELILVDDGSGDDSYRIMRDIAAHDMHVRLIRLSRNFGSHAACLAGVSACTGDCATIKTADLQEPSELILDMYRSWESGNKVVLAARTDREEGFFQKAFANAYYWLVRKFALSSMPKGGFDCYLIDRKVIEVLKHLDESNSALTLQILWAGFRRDIVYYVRKRREKGRSHWTLEKKLKLIVDSLVSFSFVPIRVASAIGVVFFFVALIWGFIVLLMRLLGKISVAGYTTMTILLLLSSGLILLILGILGEYIWRAVEAARNRPVYIVDEDVPSQRLSGSGKGEAGS